MSQRRKDKGFSQRERRVCRMISMLRKRSSDRLILCVSNDHIFLSSPPLRLDRDYERHVPGRKGPPGRPVSVGTPASSQFHQNSRIQPIPPKLLTQLFNLPPTTRATLPGSLLPLAPHLVNSTKPWQ